MPARIFNRLPRYCNQGTWHAHLPGTRVNANFCKNQCRDRSCTSSARLWNGTSMHELTCDVPSRSRKYLRGLTLIRMPRKQWEEEIFCATYHSYRYYSGHEAEKDRVQCTLARSDNRPIGMKLGVGSCISQNRCHLHLPDVFPSAPKMWSSDPLFPSEYSFRFRVVFLDELHMLLSRNSSMTRWCRYLHPCLLPYYEAVSINGSLKKNDGG